MRRTLTIAVSIVTVLLVIAAPLFAQQPTGTPNFNTFQAFPGGSINLGNLDVHLQFPIYHKEGRGTAFDANWNFDNEIWYVQCCSAWKTTLDSLTIFGTLGASVPPGTPAKYTIEQSVWCTATQSYDTYWWTNFAFTDPSGTTHSFPNAPAIAYPSCGSLNQQTSGTSPDGYKLSASVNPNTWAITSTVTGPDGIVFQGTSGTGVGTRTDRNGNVISVAGGINGQYTDTLNMVVLEGSSSGNTITYKYNGECGSMCESVTETTANYYIASAFASGCSGSIDTVSNNTTALPVKFALPDGSSYVLTWEQTPGKSSSYSTGRIKSIALPTGGTISFNYNGPNNGMNCDGTTSGMTMTTPDGTWTYSHTAAPAGGDESGTNVTDPAGYSTGYNFYVGSSLGPLETIRQLSTSTNTLLQTVITCYNGQNESGCAYSPNSISSISRITRYIELPMSGGVTAESEINEYHNSTTQLLTERDEYDWAPNQPGGLLRKTLLWYGSWNPSNNSITALGNNILDLVGEICTYNGSGALITCQAFNRDAKGNPLGVYQDAGAYNLAKHYTYNSTGTVATFTDVNGDPYSYAYGDCNGAFPTSISEPGGLSKSMTWDCDGGVLGTVTDEAGATTTIAHSGESFWRPSSMSDGLGNVTTFSYSPTTSESVLSFNNGSSTVDNLVTVDGLGRVHVSQKRQGPGSSYFDTVETDYNSDGQVSRVTMPWQGTAGQTSPQASATTYTYDGLGRTLTTVDGGGGSVSLSYNGNLVTKTISPAPAGETTKSWEYAYNAIGHLEDVCEIMPSGTTGSGACNFDPTGAKNGFWTEYSHDVLGDITAVTQNAQSTPQTRSYAYDPMGRLTSETNPESGTMAKTYTYDQTQTGAGAGDLYTSKDQNGVTITYTHGIFHRLLTASTGSFCRYFAYDSISGAPNSTGYYIPGRLAEASTTNCGSTAYTNEYFGYDADGRTTDLWESTPNSGGLYQVTDHYYPNGVVNTLVAKNSNGFLFTGLPTFTYGVDGEGRPTTAIASSGQNPLTAASYYTVSQSGQSAGKLAGVTFGSGDSDTYSYASATGRMTQYQFSINGSNVTGALTWNPNGTLQNLAITDPFNSSDAQTCTYQYDPIARLANASCGSAWSQTFGYDAYGNLTKSGSLSFQPCYNNNNQYTCLPNLSYDSDGNLLNDSFHTYTWDAFGGITAIDSATVTHDALGRVVEFSSSQVLYAPTGQKVALMSGQNLEKAFVGLPGGAQAVYTSSGLAYYRHADWLGSSRISSTPANVATPKLVQVNSATPQTNQSSVSVTFNNPQTAGNLNVVAIGWNDTTSSITSVTDSNGNGGGSTSPGTVTLVQKASNASCAGNSANCSVTVAATGASHLLIVSAAWPGAFSISSVSGGGSWVCPANAVGADNGSLGSAMCYVLSSTSGATTITVNTSAVPNGGWTIEFREYSPTGTLTFDTAGNVDDSTNCTSCSGVNLTLSGTNDLIVQLVNPTGSVTAVSSGWGGTDFPGPDYIGIADEIQTSSGAAPTWTTSNGHASGAALAFQLGTVTSGSGYTLAVGPSTGPGLSQAIYYAPNIKAGSNTVTVIFNQPATSVDIRVMEYSGVSTTDPLDVTAVGSGTSNGGNVATANATTTFPNELIVGAGMTGWGFNAAGPGFTTDIITSPDTDIAEHEVVSATGSYNASANLENHNNTTWLMQMATFKATTSPGTSVYADLAYAPYGEGYSPSGSSDASFTGQNSDMVANLYDFMFREYHSSQGRWVSPDPAGLAATDPMNPQTWNRYAYVAGNPVLNVDPLGLLNPNFGFGNGCSVNAEGTLNCPDAGGSVTVYGLQTLQPWLVTTGFGCVWTGLCNVPLEFGGSKLDLGKINFWLWHRTAPNTSFILKRISDCFSPGDAVRYSTYSLQTANGTPTTGDAVITEYQSNPYLTHNNQGFSMEADTDFQDKIGPAGVVGQTQSTRYFTVTLNGQPLGLVPVEYENGQTQAYEGIWFNGAKDSNNTQVFVNGSQATTCD